MSTEQREVPLDQGAIEHKDAGEMKQGGKWGATMTSAAAHCVALRKPPWAVLLVRAATADQPPNELLSCSLPYDPL